MDNTSDNDVNEMSAKTHLLTAHINDCRTTDDKYFYSIQITESLITNSSTMNNSNSISNEVSDSLPQSVECMAHIESIGGNGDSNRDSLEDSNMGYSSANDTNDAMDVLDVVRYGSQRSYKPSFNSRQMHNQKERMRRSRMKSSCEALRRMVPGVNDKTDKASVLEQTVNFLLHLSSCSGVNCTDYIPDIPPSISSKSMQYYQQYVSSQPMIDYHDSQHRFKIIENDENDTNVANHISGDVNANTSYDLKIIDCGDCGDCGNGAVNRIINESTARLVTTNDGQQFMVIDTQPNTDTHSNTN